MARAAAFAVALVLLTPQSVHAQTPIRDFIFDIFTKGDEKDRGESIRFQIIRNEKEVVYDSDWIHGDLVFGKEAWDSWRGTPTVSFGLEDAPKLKLRVEKQGDKGWKAIFRVRGNGDSLILMKETSEVEFGKRNTHIFSFTPTP